jgi:hypothetical protein
MTYISDRWYCGPYQTEWDQYKTIIDQNLGSLAKDIFYDMPGNHDTHNDQFGTYYLANSVQGQATGKLHVSWSRFIGGLKYLFIGINTATAAHLNDPVEITDEELQFVESELNRHLDAQLAVIFGHHNFGELKGYRKLTALMDKYGVVLYSYGHKHGYWNHGSERVHKTGYKKPILYFPTTTLGKPLCGFGDNACLFNQGYRIIAIDNNGISTVAPNVGEWPVVLITTPLTKFFGDSENFAAYDVPVACNNPIRALVFSPEIVKSVQYEIDYGEQWVNMTRNRDQLHLWEADWDTSVLKRRDPYHNRQGPGRRC